MRGWCRKEVGVAVNRQQEESSSHGNVPSLDCLKVDILILQNVAYHWENWLKSTQDICVLSYRCMWIYNYLRVKILILESNAVKATFILLYVWVWVGLSGLGLSLLHWFPFGQPEGSGLESSESLLTHACQLMSVVDGDVSWSCQLSHVALHVAWRALQPGGRDPRWSVPRESQVTAHHLLQLKRGSHAVWLPRHSAHWDSHKGLQFKGGRKLPVKCGDGKVPGEHIGLEIQLCLL